MLDKGVGTKTGRRTKATFQSGTTLKILEYLILLDWYQYQVFYRLLDDGVGTKTGRRTKATFQSGTALKISDVILDWYENQKGINIEYFIDC